MNFERKVCPDGCGSKAREHSQDWEHEFCIHCGKRLKIESIEPCQCERQWNFCGCADPDGIGMCGHCGKRKIRPSEIITHGFSYEGMTFRKCLKLDICLSCGEPIKYLKILFFQVSNRDKVFTEYCIPCMERGRI